MCKEISSQNTVRGMGSKTQLPAPIRVFPYTYFCNDFTSELCYHMFPGPQWSNFYILSFYYQPHQIHFTSAAGSSPAPA